MEVVEHVVSNLGIGSGQPSSPPAAEGGDREQAQRPGAGDDGDEGFSNSIMGSGAHDGQTVGGNARGVTQCPTRQVESILALQDRLQILNAVD